MRPLSPPVPPFRRQEARQFVVDPADAIGSSSCVFIPVRCAMLPRNRGMTGDNATGPYDRSASAALEG